MGLPSSAFRAIISVTEIESDGTDPWDNNPESGPDGLLQSIDPVKIKRLYLLSG